MKPCFVFSLLIFFSSQSSHPPMGRHFIVWNVGQGTWQTYITPNVCHHIDLGGEKTVLAKVGILCRSHKNSFSISHWDWDHFSFLRPSTRAIKGLCYTDLPKMNSPQARRYRLKECGQAPSPIEIIYHPKNKKKWKKNDQSTIHLVDNIILVPGDSTQKMEKIWLKKISSRQPHVLILGHHGSNTSTSKQLLAALPSLRQAVASARQRRYGHPHPKVKSRLKKAGLALLSTEDWGSIAFELPHDSN